MTVRILPVVLILFFVSPFLCAQDEFNNIVSDYIASDNFASNNFVIDVFEEAELPVKNKFRLKNRMIELSVLNVSFNTANNFIASNGFLRGPFDMMSSGEIFRETAFINLDDFFAGFQFAFDAVVKPVSFNFNWKDRWGFGLDIANIDVSGNLALSGNMMSLDEAEGDKFGVGGAVFVDTGIPVFFHYNDFKIKIRPSVYLPVIYTEPMIMYTRKSISSDAGLDMYLEINYDIQVYSIIDMQWINNGDLNAMTQNLADNAWDIPRNNLGYDFGLCVEYPWDYWLRLGVDIVNIPVPFATATLNHYMQMQGMASFNTQGIIDAMLDDVMKGDGNFNDTLNDILEDSLKYPESFEFQYGYNEDGRKVYRPFKMLFYVDYRPSDTYPLFLVPSLGFSINRLYTRPASIEGGLNVRFDFANIFIPTFGINYNDRKWKNSIDFALNLRAFEFNFGVAFQSQNFLKSWQGAGLGVNIGFKLGW